MAEVAEHLLQASRQMHPHFLDSGLESSLHPNEVAGMPGVKVGGGSGSKGPSCKQVLTLKSIALKSALIKELSGRVSV